MSRRLKLVEELNMEVTVEPTVEEKTQVFKDWVVERIGVCETVLSIDMHHLDYWLNRREPISEGLFNNRFEVEYSYINNDMRDAEWKCKKDGISDNVLADAIKEFKQMKSKIRKGKAEYKQKFAELQEAIQLSIENEDYFSATSNQVQDIITNWCSTYVIKEYRKSSFEGEGLLKTVNSVTKWILSRKLYPSKDEVIEFVEKYMTNETETVAC